MEPGSLKIGGRIDVGMKKEFEVRVNGRRLNAARGDLGVPVEVQGDEGTASR